MTATSNYNYLTVTIGSHPLTMQEFSDFKESTLIRVQDWVRENEIAFHDLSTFVGRNQYNGIPEDSFTIHLLSATPFNEADLHYLRQELKTLCLLFKQDAIALGFGKSVLVTKNRLVQ